MNCCKPAYPYEILKFNLNDKLKYLLYTYKVLKDRHRLLKHKF